MLIKCRENEQFSTSLKLSMWLSSFFFLIPGCLPWLFPTVKIPNCYYSPSLFPPTDGIYWGRSSLSSQSSFVYFVNSFIEVKLMYNKLYIFKEYNLVSFDMCIEPWNHHHHQGNEHIQHPQRFARAPCNLVLPSPPPSSSPYTQATDLLSFSID